MVHLELAGNRYFRRDDVTERMFLAPATFNLRRGRYSEAFRRKDEESIANLYRSNGFRDVKVATVVDRKHEGKEGRIGVTMQIEEGPQWLVGNLTIKGISQLDQ